MRINRLILLLFALVWLLPAEAQPAAPAGSAELSVCQEVERPQWVDLGMCDVLAISGSTTLTPPTTVRVVHNMPTGTSASVSAHHQLYACVAATQLARPSRVRGGYIYMLQCLRL